MEMQSTYLIHSCHSIATQMRSEKKPTTREKCKVKQPFIKICMFICAFRLVHGAPLQRVNLFEKHTDTERTHTHTARPESEFLFSLVSILIFFHLRFAFGFFSRFCYTLYESCHILIAVISVNKFPVRGLRRFCIRRASIFPRIFLVFSIRLIGSEQLCKKIAVNSDDMLIGIWIVNSLFIALLRA